MGGLNASIAQVVVDAQLPLLVLFDKKCLAFCCRTGIRWFILHMVIERPLLRIICCAEPVHQINILKACRMEHFFFGIEISFPFLSIKKEIARN